MSRLNSRPMILNMCKKLGEKTLITKGTLTGVVDRLIAKGLVQRRADATDGRRQIVQLTKKGEALFTKIFPLHIAYLQCAFMCFKTADYAQSETTLRKLREAFEKIPVSSPPPITIKGYM